MSKFTAHVVRSEEFGVSNDDHFGCEVFGAI